MADANGVLVSRQTYYPFGGQRTTTGSTLPTDYTFTGQKLDRSTGGQADGSDGLMYYGARYYDPYLNRFVQADTIVPNPGNPQSLNRYAYVRNNPITRNDPTGHCDIDECGSTYETWTDNLNDSIIQPGTIFIYVPLPGQTDPDQIMQSDPFAYIPPSNDPFWYLHTNFPANSILAYPVVVGSAGAPRYSRLPGSDPKIGDPIYRVAGGGSRVDGRSWSPTDPDLFASPKNSLGLPPENNGNIILRGTLLDPAGITVKPADPLPPSMGGASEWVVPEPRVQIQLNQVKVSTPGKVNVYYPGGRMTPRGAWEFVIRLMFK